MLLSVWASVVSRGGSKTMNGPLPLPRPIVTRAATCDVFFPASRRCARRPQKGPSTASMADRPAGRPTDCLIPLRPTTLTRTYAPPLVFCPPYKDGADCMRGPLSLSLSPSVSPPPSPPPPPPCARTPLPRAPHDDGRLHAAAERGGRVWARGRAQAHNSQQQQVAPVQALE